MRKHKSFATLLFSMVLTTAIAQTDAQEEHGMMNGRKIFLQIIKMQ